ncbi:MAG: D-glycero-beta-D-manno-heptose 1,7-bisphosphate 7-phosphatase [Candidatus Electrothrix sp. AW1]|nr:D-glycero-beta-D-manno-heptose 1,7-bisphosphate 7-phosphatase [Candidatus Electrothrix sp. AX1]MCI5181033.1 D-glycero-beta-D-manno-heptose 1,7-bisphosphate 7-phosphatase [Candidatus Electrothrix gigas]
MSEKLGQLEQPAVFLDRDGTINEQMGYINHISRFILLPGVATAIRRLNEQNIPVVVVTNQSGLARGYFPPVLLDAVHAQMERELAAQDAHIDGLYICPHHPEAKEKQFRKVCTCRKPQTGLLEQAAAELELDLTRSFMVGDRWSDLKCGNRVGATSVLVLTGYGRGDLEYIGPEQEIQPDKIAEDLSEAVDWIIEQLQ